MADDLDLSKIQWCSPERQAERWRCPAPCNECPVQETYAQKDDDRG